MTKDKKRKIILGFDGTNNGFELDSPVYKPHKDSQFVVTGYMAFDTGANYGSARYESKKRIFNKKRNVQRALTRGRAYIGENPSFFYTNFQRPPNSNLFLMKHAQAIALLTFKFFETYEIQPPTASIIIDEINGETSSRFVGRVLGAILEDANLDIPYKFKKKADKRAPSVRKADRVGYYVAAIKFLGDSHKWPFRSRRVNMNQLETLATTWSE